MKILIIIGALAIASGCASLKCFSIDGKQASWCKAKEAAKDFCGTNFTIPFDQKVTYAPSQYIVCSKDYYKIVIDENHNKQQEKK